MFALELTQLVHYIHPTVAEASGDLPKVGHPL